MGDGIFLNMLQKPGVTKTHATSGRESGNYSEKSPRHRSRLTEATKCNSGERHEFHETYHSVTFYFMSELIF